MKCKIYNGQKIADMIGYLEGYPAVFVVADRNVARLAEKIAGCRSMPGCRGIFYSNATEEDKSMQTVLDICKWLLVNDADRNALVLAVGGGITSDMAGFAASIYKRGVRYANVPTTLLAQTDAAIGGKTGVNLDNYKNILGVIRQPEFTYICPQVLESLPYRDFVSGSAELLKTFIIDNSDNNYEKAVEVLADIHGSIDHSLAIAAHSAELQQLVSAAAAIKAGVVERDEFEHGERRKLNLGHTFAHAIEWESMSVAGKSLNVKEISHGEAVSMGIILAARLSERYYSTLTGIDNNCSGSKSLSDRFQQDFTRCGLPTSCPFPTESLAAAMSKDKKAENGIIHFVLIHGLGDVRIEDLTVEDMINC